MAHSYSNLLIHLVWSTKGRQPWIVPVLKPHLHAYIGGIFRELQVTPLIVNGVSDHVHALVLMPTSRAPADVMRVVKANSSRWVRGTWDDQPEFAWQTGYGAFSVSQAHRERVWRYIERQEEHHLDVGFQDEYLGMLQAEGLEYDERYPWG